jgi:phosphatidylserine/phosphatidylglycerophosphate/cardiolipin synthase-like enzyme
MRVREKEKNGVIHGLAVAGTRFVGLGWDMSASDIKSKKVLGFAIKRTRKRDGEVIFLKGMKTFKSILADPGEGVKVSSMDHPFQSFQWSDYTVSPDESYTYRVIARTGTPDKLKDGPSATFEVETEREDVGKHSVYFNRGAVASQAYADRFHNRSPDKVGQAAWDWLARGLIEALERFIGQAGEGDELHGAIFEFKHPRVYTALKAAKGRKAKIYVIYDGDTQGEANEKELRANKVFSWLPKGTHLRAREHSGQYAHNKFFVLSRNGVPKQVWTGSTNLSTNGIFGHSNNAHVVRDEDVARAFKEYWNRLWEDPTKKPLATKNSAETPAPPKPGTAETTPIFSPQPDTSALEWYAKLAGKPKKPLFMTFAFGMDNLFVPVYERDDGVIRYALMEKKGNGKTFKEQAKVIDRIRKLPNVVVAVGDAVDKENTFDRWLAERVTIVNEAHVRFVHTKYMLVDPLGENPIVVVGSANFSKASCDTNDENMLVIQGNTQVADIYFGEFMRLHVHYAYRESLHFTRKPSDEYEARRKYLVETTDWIYGEEKKQSYFDKRSARALRRVYFSGGGK